MCYGQLWHNLTPYFLACKHGELHCNTTNIIARLLNPKPHAALGLGRLPLFCNAAVMFVKNAERSDCMLGERIVDDEKLMHTSASATSTQKLQEGQCNSKLMRTLLYASKT